jgi:acetylornithine deacetylase
MDQSKILDILRALVACDTQNPPRQITGDSDIFQVCAEASGSAYESRTWDHGDGHVSWYAVRGKPRILFNVHLDTVPSGEGWQTDPLSLTVRDNRVYGRGSCDIKGAAAVLLSLAEQGVKDLAMLFTTDEEGAGGCCVSKFIDTGLCEEYEQIIVAEPTGCKAILGHRGFLSVKTRFKGHPGHSSEARALNENANHRMAIWASEALKLARQKKRSDTDPGTCMNIGLIDGGTKSNVIAGQSFVHWSARLRPGESNLDFLRKVQACDADQGSTTWEVPFSGEPLPATGQNDRAARDFCTAHRLETGNPVDFWTEAALFSGAGLPVMVLGPGNIEQAHITDEWVALDQLSRACDIYSRLVKNHA